MTLDEAIGIKEKHLEDNAPYDLEELEAADRLSLEALKAWKIFREVASPRPVLIDPEDNSDLVSLLPGETKD